MLQQISQLQMILEYLLLRIPYLNNRVWMKEPKTTHLITYLQGENEDFRVDDISRKVKLEDLSDILKDTRSAFFTPDSLLDEPIIISEESEEEEEVVKDKDTEDTSKEELKQAKAEAEVASMKAKPSYPDITQLTEILVTSLKLELSKLLTSHDFTRFLIAVLKKLPSKITELSGEIKELKQHVSDMEIELPGDLENLQTMDSLPSLLHKVTDTLNRFSTMMDNASGATSMNVPSAYQATALPAEGGEEHQRCWYKPKR
ncbi:hypothetical protein Tco_1549071 [Tanacetum coccineum]